ncbi:glycosyltransferase [Flavobacterium soli]|uniref:glycosyltransferase n=1 Tax=Flavobacterium soli TaxID=344881 RepID=UPI0004169A27|nr:glycosyltransferase [Flavobacterium soli]
MKLLIISSAPIVTIKGCNYLYSPYEKEIRLWIKYANQTQFCCPVWREDRGLLVHPISFDIESTVELKEFDITKFKNILKAIPLIFINAYSVFKAMQKADHIHLRCPGNMGLIGAVMQVLFPKKTKTAKYAGNWDPKAQQPFTYKLQRWILANTFLTQNMQVLVYGEWENQSKNIKPFFTATYSEKDKLPIVERGFENTIELLFVGALAKGKQPLYAVQMAEGLHELGCKVRLKIYGEGKERGQLEEYIKQKQLTNVVFLMGNQAKNNVKAAYQNSHFLILASKSEGWPKVVAEAMFWGCVPVASSVSCVSTMLGNEERGMLLTMDLAIDVTKIKNLIHNETAFFEKSNKAAEWSRNYTLDYFESALQQLLKA